jgi:predicted  nucleic acid-binding Zn-ribbon protein
MVPDNAPPDAIPLSEAAALVGKTAKTLRRWRAKGAFAFTYAKDGRAYVSRSELLTVAGLQAEGHPAAPVHKRAPPASPQALDGSGLQAVLAAYESTLATLQGERDYWREEADKQRGEIADLRERLRAVESELNQGARGLLEAGQEAARARREADLLAQEMAAQEKRLTELERPSLRAALRGRFGL